MAPKKKTKLQEEDNSRLWTPMMDAALASLLVCHSDESSEEELREPEVQAPRIRTLEHYFHVPQVRIQEVEHIVHVPQTQETVTHVPELLTDVQEQRTSVAPIQTAERTADVSQASAGSLHEHAVGLSDGRNTVSRQLPRCGCATWIQQAEKSTWCVGC